MKTLRLVFPFTFFFLTSSIALGEARCPANGSRVQYHSLTHAHIGVSTTVNGSGPYEFMVDTGAQITVIDPALARELKLEPSASLHVSTVTSNVEVPLVTAGVFAVGTASVEQLQMAVEELGPIQSESASLRGILGNNFLSRFDLLIDNSHKLLCFDATRQMQQALRGDRVPILQRDDADTRSSAHAILVVVHLPDDGKEGSVFRLDSGSNVPLLYSDRQARAMTRPRVSPVRGRTIGAQAQFLYAITPARTVRLGARNEMEIAFATPPSRLLSKPAEDGLLPTALFHRVFISFADNFVMFDPR